MAKKTKSIIYYRVTYHFRNTDVCFRTAEEAQEYVDGWRDQYWHSFHRTDDPWGYRPIYRKRKGA